MHLLHTILPPEGFYCVDKQLPTGATKHFWHNSIDDALKRIEALTNAGETVFIAQAAFKTMNDRSQSNVRAVRSFWTDIDCGKGKPHASQRDGILALKRFCETAELPIPAVVSSGNGLYAHWPLTSELPPAVWSGIASLLKKVMDSAGFKADSCCTADSSRILRPVGALHRKDPTNPKPVVLLKGIDPIDTIEFGKAVKSAAEKLNISIPRPAAPKNGVNSEFLAGLSEDIKSSAVLIAQKCAQIAHIEATKGDVSEPLWYAAVGLLRHTTEAPRIVHEWSSGHHDYSPAATDLKIAQHESNNIGPTCCSTFDSLNPGVCAGCKHAEKIKSPILLGRVMPEKVQAADLPPDEERLPDPPEGFQITKSGVFFSGEPPTMVYPHVLYISAVNSDHFGESVTVRHHLPHDGWREFSVASSKVADSKGFFSSMLENHVHVIGKDQKGLFMSYFELMMQKVRSAHKITQLSHSMGWVGEGSDLRFAHGNETYHKDGKIDRVAYGAATPEFVKTLKPEGNAVEWVAETARLNDPGMEGFAFEFLCAAFGSPLVKFSGFSGAMVSVVGNSGVGKTVAGQWGLSAWGHPDKLTLLRDDTRNALLSRLGVYGSLPVYIDEMSNINQEELSEMTYRITQGREKLRLDRSSREKKVVNTWCTLAVVSSNQSLMDKLSAMKGEADGELNRVFEYEVYEGFDKASGGKVAGIIRENYGVVGREYAKWLVVNQDRLKDDLAKVNALIDQKAAALPEERFLTMLGAVAIYGGTVAKQLGLSLVDTTRLIPWVCEQIDHMRRYRMTHSFDAISWLGAFIDRHIGEIITVKSYDPHGAWDGAATYLEPRTRLVGRIEEDRSRLWISIDSLKKDLTREHISYTKMLRALQGSKGGSMLLNSGARITLGRGTRFSGVIQRCWEIDLSHPELGRRVLQAVRTQADRKAVFG